MLGYILCSSKGGIGRQFLDRDLLELIEYTYPVLQHTRYPVPGMDTASFQHVGRCSFLQENVFSLWVNPGNALRGCGVVAGKTTVEGERRAREVPSYSRSN